MNMDKILKQAQKMQAQMALANEQLEKVTVEGTAGGEMVKATVNGHGDLISISISPEVVNKEDIEMLEDLVLAAVKDALKKSREIANNKINSATGGLAGGLPGFM